MTRTAVVTGGSGGIGSEVVSQLRARGWNVVSLSRHDGTDVSDEEAVVSAFGRLDSLDSLIHCAAELIKRPFADMSAGEWDAQLGDDLGADAPRAAGDDGGAGHRAARARVCS